jgi:Arc/MetJ-type ribon-helix-helix transcriptional regulator
VGAVGHPLIVAWREVRATLPAMNKPVRTGSVSVTLPTSAVEELETRVAAGEFATLDEAVTAALLELEHFRAIELVGGEAAFQALAEEIEVDPSVGMGEIDAFEFLHALKAKYDGMADARDERA